jgi:integrase
MSAAARSHRASRRTTVSAVSLRPRRRPIPRGVTRATWDCRGRKFSHGLAAAGAGHRGGIRTVQELLGHRDVKTTMTYTHVLNRGGRGVESPADRLLAAPSGAIGREASRANGRGSARPVEANHPES